MTFVTNHKGHTVNDILKVWVSADLQLARVDRHISLVSFRVGHSSTSPSPLRVPIRSLFHRSDTMLEDTSVEADNSLKLCSLLLP